MLTSYQAYTPLSDYLKEENFSVYSDKRVDDLLMLMDQLKEQVQLYDYFFGYAHNLSNIDKDGLLDKLTHKDKHIHAS